MFQVRERSPKWCSNLMQDAGALTREKTQTPDVEERKTTQAPDDPVPCLVSNSLFTPEERQKPVSLLVTVQ
jgi:hypothetical protein